MGWTSHGKIGCKLKEGRYNLEDKTNSKGININFNLIEYVTKTLVKK